MKRKSEIKNNENKNLSNAIVLSEQEKNQEQTRQKIMNDVNTFEKQMWKQEKQCQNFKKKISIQQKKPKKKEKCLQRALTICKKKNKNRNCDNEKWKILSTRF